MNAETGFSLRNFILKVILVILFVFLLMWLFPMPNMKPLYDRLFAENVETMKEAAKAYYTVERLPKEVGQTVKMTLNEMLTEKLVLPIIDSKGNVCNGDASYVSITKTDKEYVIKTSLTCGNQTDYILEHMGCYNICNDTCKIEEPQKQQIKTQKQVIIKETIKETVKEVIKEPEKPTPPTVKKYLYTYRKDFSATYTDWSPWTEVRYVDSDNISFGCSSTKCVEVAPNSPRYEQIGTKTTTTTVYAKDAYGNKIPVYQDKRDNIMGTYQVQVCADYDYVIYNGYGTYSYSAGDQWSDPVLVQLPSMPADTATEKYEFVRFGFDAGCTGDCKPNYVLVNKSVLKGSQISTSTSPSSISVTCSNVVTKTVNVYGIRSVFVGYKIDHYSVDVTKLYGYVKYYRYKTRNLISSSYYDIQTRYYEDHSLINNGYYQVSKVEI